MGKFEERGLRVLNSYKCLKHIFPTCIRITLFENQKIIFILRKVKYVICTNFFKRERLERKDYQEHLAYLELKAPMEIPDDQEIPVLKVYKVFQGRRVRKEILEVMALQDPQDPLDLKVVQVKEDFQAFLDPLELQVNEESEERRYKFQI